MQGFKSQASQKPTAMGSLLQASAYGATVPVVYGQTQSPLNAIWAANLRQGGGVKKFKQFKKGITNYVENIDFILGHSPIMGVLQVMVNGGNYPLNFTSQSLSAAAGAGSYEITDSNFYFVIAVTLTVDYSFDVNDYGGQGAQTLTGSYEIPLWNELETGPDPTNPTTYRCWPFCYRWQPGFGATIQIDAETFPGGTLNIYYAQLTDATSYQTPLAKLGLVYENELGNGEEYAEAPSPFNEQQIVYPHFAGCGGSAVDLGASGALPQLQPEVRGKWGIYSTGDADFADMIEDVFKSGLAQAAIAAETAYTQMERGLSSYGLPGTVQKKVNSSSTVAPVPMLYDMPNTAGNVLIAAVQTAGTLSIGSSAGDGWAPLFEAGSGWQVWYAIAAGGQNTVTISGGSAVWQAAILEIDMGSPAAPFPVAPAPGQATVILSPSIVTTSELGVGLVTAVAGYPATGDYSVIGESGFGGSEAVATWSGFTMGPIPPTATSITGTLYALLAYETGGPEDANFDAPFSLTAPGWNSASAVGVNLSYADFAAALATYTAQIVAEAGPEGPYNWTGQVRQLFLSVSFDAGGAASPIAAGNPIDAVVVTAETSASITSTVQQGFPAFVLAIPFYSSSDAPAGMNVVNWDDLTPANFYGNSTAAFQMQGRAVRSPGAYNFTPQGTAPSAMALIALKSTVPSNYPLPLGDFIDLPSLDLVRAQCRANGLWGSLSMNSQSAASDWLKTLYQAANAAPVFLGSKLYSFPYSEVSAAGNGCTYTAPTAVGPIADLDAANGDFVGDSGCPKLTTGSRVGLPNVLQMQCVDRNSQYNQVVVQQPDAASIALYGERKADPIVNNAVQDPSIARSLLGIQVRRNQYGGDSYAFTASARWSLLAPMDLITLTDELQGLGQLPVRITAYNEQEDGSWQGTAEPFVYGVNAPTALPVTSSTQNPTGITEGAGDVNAPIVFEPVPRLCANQNQAQLWLVVSSSADNYGGCQVYISTDGGDSYNPAGDPLLGSAITGETTADWPAAATPDTTNDLALSLTESDGALQGFSVSDQDNFLYPCYVAGGGVAVQMGGTEIAEIGSLEMGGSAIADLGAVQMGGTEIAAPGFGYELMTYATAVLTAANQYTLKATGSGNHLDRAVFNAPDSGTGVDHPTGSRFALLSPSGIGILKLNMDTQWIGVELFFKIISFNEFGAAPQGLGDVPAYSYTPTGVPYA